MTRREVLTLEAPEIRLSTEGEAGAFEGYAAVFNDVVKGYRERVIPGAFKNSLGTKKRLPPMLWNHNSDEPVGIWTAMVEDDRGLKVTGKLITTIRRGQESLEMMRAGMDLGLSIGFRTLADRQTKDGIRELTELELIEVSITSNPASDNARVTKFRNAASSAGTAAFLEAVRRAVITLKGAS